MDRATGPASTDRHEQRGSAAAGGSAARRWRTTVLFAGWATIAAGMCLLLAAARHWGSVPAPVRLVVPKGITSHRFAGVVIGAEFMIVGRGLLLRRWLACRAMIVVVFVAALVNAVGSSPHRTLALTGLAVGTALVATRGAYRVEPDSSRVLPSLAAAAGTVAALGVATTAWLVWRHPATGSRPPLGHAARAAITAMAGADGVLGQVAGGDAYRLSGVLLAVTVVVVLATTVVLLSPHAPPSPDPADRNQVEALVARREADGLAPFALRHDKAYSFSPDGRAAIGYKVISGVALFGGDPVGDPASYAGAVDAFLDACARHGWRPAGIGVRGDRVATWAARGMRAIGVGDEAVVSTSAFELGTPRLRNVRQAVKRSRNFGVRTRICLEADLTPTERDELLSIARSRWGGAERGFSMNLDHVLDGTHPQAVVVTARDAGGRPVGFQRYAPSGAGLMLSLDTMVRAVDAPNGVNERMIVDVIEWGREHGASHVSLNFAAFRRLFEKERRSGLERLGYWGAHRFDRYIKIESLYRFNRKFRPTWVPRSVVFCRWSDLGWVLLAALRAEFGVKLPWSTEGSRTKPRQLLRSLPRPGGDR